MPSNCAPSARFSQTDAPQGRRATSADAAAAQLGGEHELTAAVESHGAQVLRRPLVAHRERGQAVHLVAPQIDAHRHVGRGGEDVDDAAAHREFAAVLHLVLAPVAHGHELGQQLRHVDLLPRADDDRRRPTQRAQPLQDGPDRGDDHPGRRGKEGVRRRGQRVEHRQAATHRLGLGAHPLERECLPGRQHGDRSRQRAHDPARRGPRPSSSLAIRQDRSSPSRSASRPVAVITSSGVRSVKAASAAATTDCAASGTATVASAAPISAASTGSLRSSRGTAARLPDVAATAAVRHGSRVAEVVGSVVIGQVRQRVAPQHGGVHAVGGDALDGVRRRLDRAARSSRTALGGRLAGRGTRPGRRSGACPPRCAPAGSPLNGGATATERSPLCPARPPPAFRRTVPGGRSSSSWTITMEGGLVDPEPRGQGRTDDPESFMYVVGTARATRRPAQGHDRRTGLDALLGPQRRAVALGQQFDRVGPGVVQAPGEFRPGVAQPDDEQVRRRPRCSDRAKGRRRA